MLLMFCSGVFGNFELLEDDITEQSLRVSHFFIAGNIGLGSNQTKGVDLICRHDIHFITGKHEDFGLIKELDFYKVNPSGISIGNVKISGVSGTYSPKFYASDGAPKRHMTRSDLFSVPKNQDIVMMHNIPGKLTKNNSVDFDDEFYEFIENKVPRFIFIGGYNRFAHFTHPLGTTVLFLVNLDKGFFTLNTANWEIFYNKRV